MVRHNHFESLGSTWLWILFGLLCVVHQVQAHSPDADVAAIIGVIVGVILATAFLVICAMMCKKFMCPDQNRGRTVRFQGRPMANGRSGGGGGHTAINMTHTSAYAPHHSGGAYMSDYAGGFDTDSGGGFGSGGCDSGGGGGGGGGGDGGGGGGGGCD